jgi:hypothetical protein
MLAHEDYSLPAADFWKPATTQAINIGPPVDTIRISQTILDSQPEPCASACKNSHPIKVMPAATHNLSSPL